MSKIAIQPTPLPLGLGTADAIEIIVHYSIGDETTDLHIHFYDGLRTLNVTPMIVPVPAAKMQEWDYDFGQIVTWTMQQMGAEFPEP